MLYMCTCVHVLRYTGEEERSGRDGGEVKVFVSGDAFLRARTVYRVDVAITVYSIF